MLENYESYHRWALIFVALSVPCLFLGFLFQVLWTLLYYESLGIGGLIGALYLETEGVKQYG